MAQAAIPARHKPHIKIGWGEHTVWVASRTQPDYYHMVNAATRHCTCPAGQHGKTCWHVGVALQLDAVRHQGRTLAQYAQ